MCGEGAVTDRMCQSGLRSSVLEVSHWTVLRSGRPVEVDSNQIETLTENNQRYSMQERAGILKIPKSIKLLVKMKTVSYILQKKIIWTFWPIQYLKSKQKM